MAHRDSDLIPTSQLAKLYRTTTSDIEKKLKTMGHQPVRTVIQQSGRRFMVWDKDASIKALDDYKQRRLEMLQDRENQRLELAAKQHTIPRTGYAAPLPEVSTDFGGLDDADRDALLLGELRETQERLARLEALLKDRKKPDAANE